MTRTLLTFSAFFFIVCNSLISQPLNTLSPQEKQQGWKLLFNGKNLAGWHRYNGKGTPASWKVEQGEMHLDVPNETSATPRDAGDLVTDMTVSGDFEFKADFKLKKYTNSGFFFFVQEDPKYKKVYDTSLEVQVGDDVLYGKEIPHPHYSGDLFGIADVRIQETKPLGSWNQLHVVLRKNILKVTLNGYTVQEHNLNSADWKQRVASRKEKDIPFAKGKFSGKIGLQDWNTGVWFRNIKLKTY